MSFAYNKLRGVIKEKFGTQEAFAKALDISCVSLSSRLNGKTYFKQSEILLACELLDIDAEEVSDYFFTLGVQKS